MKCSKCGFKARDINGMRKHYLKKHPGAMKRGPRKRRMASMEDVSDLSVEVARALHVHEEIWHGRNLH